MSKYSLIAGINWAIALTAVVGSVFVLSQIFAPIPPASWSVGAPGTQVQEQLKSANQVLPLSSQGSETYTPPLQSTQVSSQQKFSTVQPQKNDSADPGPASGISNTANQSTTAPRPQPERYNVSPTSPAPPPSAGSESLPAYMRYF
jgi:hypothetical protein